MSKRVAVQEHTDYQPKARNGGLIAGAAVVALIISGAGGFFAGYQIGGNSDGANQNSQQAGMNGGPGGMMGGGQFGMGGIGTVTAVDDDSITIEDQRQGEKTTYAITSSTEVTDNGDSVTVSDIEVGDTVMVSSDDDSNSDSKTASSIRLNPSFGGGPGGNTQNSQSSSSGSSESSI